MAIIYTYPEKTTPNDNDLILISDSQDSNKTKQIKVSSLPGGSSSGVSSVTATLPVVSSGGSTPVISLKDLAGFGNAGQVIKVNSNADGLEWGAAGGSTSPDSPVNSVQFNEAGAFGGSSNFKYTDSNRTLNIGEQDANSGIINIAGGSTGGAGQLQLGDDGTSGNYITLKAATDIPNPYNIVLPSTTPAGGSKILESDASGNLSWISTPTGNNTNIYTNNGTLADDRTISMASYNLTLNNNSSERIFKFHESTSKFEIGNSAFQRKGTLRIEGEGSNNRGGLLEIEAGGINNYHVQIKGPNTMSSSYDLILPDAQGTASSVLTNNGSGTLSWATTSEPTEITSTTSANPTTFANTPFTFANTNAGSGIGAPVATQVSSGFGNKHISFYYGTVLSGSIDQNGASSVSYATSSDYRLKENVVEMTGAVDRVKQLNPSRFNFIADGPSRTVDGFLAHEVSSVVPEAITGEKDAVDAEGNIIAQGIDQSKLVPLLVGAIKELTARIEALEA